MLGGHTLSLPYENHRQNQATQNILAASLEQCQAVFYFALDSSIETVWDCHLMHIENKE